MIKRGLQSLAATWLAGFLVLLPLAVTLALLGWLVGLIYGLVGPGTLVGRLSAALGYPFSSHPGLAYLFGTLVLLATIYLLGLLAESRLKPRLAGFADRTLRRLPLVGDVYGLADRFVGLLNQKHEADIGAMRPVWCFFGGDGVAVLALAPSAETIEIEGRDYYAVIVPTAPIPFGGALLYVPAGWVRPAHIGVDRLTATYVSMGISPRSALPLPPTSTRCWPSSATTTPRTATPSTRPSRARRSGACSPSLRSAGPGSPRTAGAWWRTSC